MTEKNIESQSEAPINDEGVNLEVSPDEDSKIDLKMNQEGLSAFDAEYRVIGLERACARRGLSLQEGKAMLHLPQEEPAHPKGEQGYPGRNAYRGRTRSGKHPIGISQRVRTVGDANSGDPDLR